MVSLPALPDTTPDGFGSARIAMRYEDLAQDGRVLVESLATSVNDALWAGALREHPLNAHAFERGTLAILTRFVVEGAEGPFPIEGPFDADARFVLARGTDASGAVDRLYLNAWVDTYAPLGRTNLPPPANAGERALVGRAFAEHVFTRPFGPPSERKVVRLEVPGCPAVPETRYQAEPPAHLLQLPPGATPIAETSLDATPIVFGLRHTDSNQHVNSLVYPRLFEEATLRRFAALGLDTAVLARTLEIAYRKPCFAGQTTRVALSVFRVGDRLGACGGFYAASDVDGAGPLAGAAPHAFVRTTFAPSR